MNENEERESCRGKNERNPIAMYTTTYLLRKKKVFSSTKFSTGKIIFFFRITRLDGAKGIERVGAAAYTRMIFIVCFCYAQLPNKLRT